MKLLCERNTLEFALGLVIGRTKSKEKIPILSHVKLTAGNGTLLLSATDLDSSSEASLGAEITAPGETVIPADRLTRLICGFPQGAQVTIEANDQSATVRSGRSIYKLPTLPAADWPEMAGPVDPTEFTIVAADAKRLFGLTQVAIKQDLSRRFLEGGFIRGNAKGDAVSVTGTDGNRMVRLHAASECAFDRGAIIPKPAMTEIFKLASGGDMQVRISDRLIQVETKTCTFTSKLIEATYPELDEKIPPTSNPYIMMEREDILGALRRLALLANDYSSLNFRWEAQGTTLNISLAGEGEGDEIVACESNMPNDGVVAFMPKLLTPVLEIFEGNLLHFHISGSSTAMRIADPAAPEIVAVAMPCAPKGVQVS